ncbi:hypothetical protein TPE_2409 [Treponema pedis str. T A4]|uniref:Uncharacterized protein n=1 Tax=Treponema pedis str. T A4 TaxID=1291379 RepID=S6A1S8_9SPIR|nr:hypothetical protein TPE_2409 [Treponema pedis str. T A4]
MFYAEACRFVEYVLGGVYCLYFSLFSSVYIIARFCEKNKGKEEKNSFFKGERENPVPSRVFSLPLVPPLSFPHGLRADFGEGRHPGRTGFLPSPNPSYLFRLLRGSAPKNPAYG